MNNNYESNYLLNYLNNNDSNYYNSFNNQINDNRFDSLNDNSYPNIDYKIATNIASNYRQFGNGWHPSYGYPQTGVNSYYEPNCSNNCLEPSNVYQSFQSEEVNPYDNPFPYGIQINNYLDQTDKTFDGILKSNFDNLIPLTVHEVEKQIKTERENDGIVWNQSNGSQTDCLQLRQEIFQIAEQSNQTIEFNDNENIDNNGVETKTHPKLQRMKRKNRKCMSHEELRREKRESNRLAATKCRQKKLQQLEALDLKSKHLIEENDKLEQRLKENKTRVFESKLSLIYHRNSECLLNAFRT